VKTDALSAVASAVLRRLAPVICKRLSAELQIQEMDLITANAPLRGRCERRVESCAHALLASFAERNAYHRAHHLTAALYPRYGPCLPRDLCISLPSSPLCWHRSSRLMLTPPPLLSLLTTQRPRRVRRRGVRGLGGLRVGVGRAGRGVLRAAGRGATAAQGRF
jgi:hypothetical protein